MSSNTPKDLLGHVRAAAGPGALTNLPSIVLSIGLAAGADPSDSDFAYTPSMTVAPAVHPTLAALLDTSGATRRGRATWQVGLGPDSPKDAVPVLLKSAREGTIWWKQDLVTRTTARNLRSGSTRHSSAAWAAAERLDYVGGVFRGVAQAYRPNEYATPRPGFDDARFGVVSLNASNGSLWISVHTTDYLTLPAYLSEEIGDVPLHLWQPGRPFKDPVTVLPAQALAIAEWARTQGLTLIDPDQSGALATFKAAASRSVVAWPRRGRPAQATIAVGAHVSAKVRKALGVAAPAQGRSAVLVDTDSVPLAAAIAASGAGTDLIHPAVLDAARMAAATPVVDPVLRGYQQEAVGLHLSTAIGYLNASSPGLGKTVMVLYAMRQRARKISAYRGLVVAEANVRHQWSSEAAVWFPEATVVTVSSRSDVELLQHTLEEAGPFPVVVITSYALASDVSDYLGEKEDVDAAAAVLEPAPLTPTPAVDDQAEPADLLELLDLLLSQDAEPKPTPTGEPADPYVGFGALGRVLLGQLWHDIVADEAAVTLRSTGTKQAKSLWHLRANSQVAVALTGTPVSKGINDLGALLSWVRKDRRMFHGVSLERQFDLSDNDQLADFTKALGALMFRRDKSEIASELPDVESTVMSLQPSAAELALANAARHELKRAYMELVSWLDTVSQGHPDDPQFADAKVALEQARHAWLGGTTLARMASSDPEAMLTAKGAGAALLASQGLVAAATAEPGTKRMAVITDLVQRVGRGERVLIFTEFATIARSLVADLEAIGLRVGQVLGGGGARRDRHVEAFRRGDLEVLVCTSAGERGLNLQTASTVVHYDLPWTPEGIIQRTGRVERIGATADKVQIVFPVMAGTIEERVASVVVARAGVMMRALDTSRGVDARHSDVGRALGTLASAANVEEVSTKEAALLRITRELLSA